ncbi:MAG: hypothetical protein IAF58_21925 [Leptolyngbya sp.]|nr:hypothetical protein [Candidatus Melainabacteria bacterium]
MTSKKALTQLRQFVGKLVSDRINSALKFNEWKRIPGNEQFMAQSLGYVRKAGMPSVTSLIRPFFHPTLPLIGLNYTEVAHVTLHAFADGWTPAIRLCRGVVFDRRGTLVAFPFPKFFNYGEHAETQDLPDGPWEAMVKEDGHLAIIFQYRGQVIATTRGSFTSPSGKIANQLLVSRQEAWSKSFPSGMTVLAEFIHPETKVILDYAGAEEFILLAAYEKKTLKDVDHDELNKLGERLGLRVVERWQGDSLETLMKLVKRTEFENKEGFVVRFPQHDRRVKFKFSGYVGKMIEEKLTTRYVMLRMIEGSLEEKFADLPFELREASEKLAAELMAVTARTSKKEQLQYLYELVPVEERTQYHKTVCQKFRKHLETSGQLSAA